MQHGAQTLLRGASLEASEIAAFAEKAISEAKGALSPLNAALDMTSLKANCGGSISLAGLSKITGIGQLNPRTPLVFGMEKIAVVYGSNGSGKSSYVRILKHACDARQKGALLGDVFSATTAAQSCSISFHDGCEERTIQWSPESGALPELSSVDIFDASCGQTYLASEEQASYEPRSLGFLSGLATLCDQVTSKLTEVIASKPSSLPAISPEFSSSAIGRWYQSLSALTESEAVEKNCTWSEKDEEELASLVAYLAERSPKDRAKEQELKKSFVDGLISSLKEHCAAVSDEACRAILKLRQTAWDKQKTAELAAKVNLESAALSGIGTKQWLALWSIARTYSVEVAYVGEPFPNIGENSRCVLCQQELTPDAKKRLASFEDYVRNEASAAAKAAKDELQKAIEMLPSFPDEEKLDAKAASAGLSEELQNELKRIYVDLTARRAMLLKDCCSEDFGPYPNSTDWIAGAQAMADCYAAKAKEFLEGFSEEERAAKVIKRQEMLARKWLAAQKAAVESEIKRLQQIAILNKAKDLCGTRAISLKKGALAEQLITPAYIEAFNSELKRLGARRVRVALVKTRVARGAILHQVKLRDALRKGSSLEVLSEGEHRIVCIAAFLADMASNPNGSTFVFDDPISSLDLDFEEAVVQRLVALSNSRQVIIFTHRLSLLGMVQDYAKKAHSLVRVVHIRKEPWGAGEPGDDRIESATPKAVLNEHLPKRILAAKAILEKEGDAAYKVHAQCICSEMRKLVERMVESDLLADVICRHRRVIKTLNQIDKLADITPEDCAFIDEMMTKYSRYEHSQSVEAPVEVPQPDEISEDATKLKEWRDALEKRRKSLSK